MSKARTSVEKAKASKDNRNKIVSKASGIVNALLEPASQVANLLNGLGGLFAPCGVAGNMLKVRIQRREWFIVSTLSSLVGTCWSRVRPTRQRCSYRNRLCGNGLLDCRLVYRDKNTHTCLQFPSQATTLVTLGTLKPGFQTLQSLIVPLEALLKRICNTMKSFGQFSE